jgi:FMN reductase
LTPTQLDPAELEVVVVSASSRIPSRVDWMARYGAAKLQARGARSRHIRIADLPAEAMVHVDATEPTVASAVAAVCAAHGVVLVTPVYNAAYSGLMKLFLDLLPRFGLRGKAVLSLSVAGRQADTDALDYALPPVLRSLAACHVVAGPCLLDRQLAVVDGDVIIDAGTAGVLLKAIDEFHAALANAAMAPATTR